MPSAKGQLMFLALLAAAAPAQRALAEIVVAHHPLEPTRDGQYSNLGPSNQQVADDFALTQKMTLTSVSWYGRYGEGISATSPVSFVIRFFANAGGAPATTPLQHVAASVAASDAGTSFGSIPWLQYSAVLPGIVLDSGDYWISIMEDDLRTPTSGESQWLWADTTTNGVRALRNSDAETWTATMDIDHAFTLTGTPEPVTLSLLALGGLAMTRRRR